MVRTSKTASGTASGAIKEDEAFMDSIDLDDSFFGGDEDGGFSLFNDDTNFLDDFGDDIVGQVPVTSVLPTEKDDVPMVTTTREKAEGTQGSKKSKSKRGGNKADIDSFPTSFNSDQTQNTKTRGKKRKKKAPNDDLSLTSVDDRGSNNGTSSNKNRKKQKTHNNHDSFSSTTATSLLNIPNASPLISTKANGKSNISGIRKHGRKLPTQRTRKGQTMNSSSTLQSDQQNNNMSSNNDFTTKSKVSLSSPSSSSSYINQSNYLNGSLTNTLKSNTSLNKPTGPFFPFRTIPPSCLHRKNESGIIGEQGNIEGEMFPHLYQILTNSNSATFPPLSAPIATSISANKDNPQQYATQNLLIQLILNYVGPEIVDSSSSNHHSSLPQSQATSPLSTSNQIKNTKKSKKKQSQQIMYIHPQSITTTKSIMNQNVKRQSLVSELKGLLKDVKKQSAFLADNLIQMNSWCDDNYKDFSTSKKQKKMSSSFASSTSISALASSNATSVGVLPHIIHGIFQNSHTKSSLSQQQQQHQASPLLQRIISVKLKFKGINKKDSSKSVQASIPSNCSIALQLPAFKKFMLSSSALVPSTINSGLNIIGADIASPIKKRKLSNSTNNNGASTIPRPTASSSKVLSQHDKNKNSNGNDKQKQHTEIITKNRIKQYHEMDTSDKYKVIMTLLSQRKALFQHEIQKSILSHDELTHKRYQKQCDIIETNRNDYMNTITLWSLMKELPHWDDLSKEDTFAALSKIWHPMVSLNLEMQRSDGVVPSILSKKKKKSKLDNDCGSCENGTKRCHGYEEDNVQVSSYSIFDRLQSMLVEENESDIDDGDGSDDDGDNTFHSNDEDDLIDVDDSDDEMDDLLDISKLSMDQRAYIHLRAIHLIDQPFLPTSDPFVIEVDEEDTSNEETSHNEDHNDSIDVLICQKQNELSHQHLENNTIAALLQNQIDEEIVSGTKKRQMKEEQNALTVKYSQLVMKSSKKKEESNKKQNGSGEWIP